MPNTFSERKTNILRFNRTKPGIGAENHIAGGRRLSTYRRPTQGGFSACSSGTLIHDSDPTLPVQLHVVTYDEHTYSEGKYNKVGDIPSVPLGPLTPITWIDVDGIHYQDIISDLGDRYDIHSLVQTDITTIEQRTKLDVFEDSIFLVCKLMFRDVHRPANILVEQITFYLKDNMLITFRETPKDLLESIKNRIRQGKGRIRKSKVDYLFYSLLDIIVDHYMDVLDSVGIKVEEIDNKLMKNIKHGILESIYDIKRDMLYIRSVIYPLKEIIIKLQKEEETQLIQESTIIYLKDLFDHVVQVNDSIDTYREMLASFVDYNMMLNSNNMNQVVKTLTIISTIFIPLTFISGVYGMNFQNMPELTYPYGYYIVLGVMATLAIFMLSCFKRKKWF